MLTEHELRMCLAHVIESIAADIASGRIPKTGGGTFEALHDHVDANQYADDVMASLHPDVSGEDFLAAVNEIESRTDAVLRRADTEPDIRSTRIHDEMQAALRDASHNSDAAVTAKCGGDAG